MKLIYINHRNCLEKHKKNWQKLFAISDEKNIFLSLEWYDAWTKTLDNNREIVIVLVYKSDKLVALFPFKFTKHISFAYDPMIADYNGFLVQKGEENIAKQALDQIFKNKASLFLYPICDNGYQMNLMQSTLKDGWFVNKKQWSQAPYIEINGTFLEYKSKLSKRLKQELRTALNHLKKKGKFSFHHLIDTDNRETACKLFNKLVELHKKRQVNKPGYSIFSDIKNLIFFKQLINNQNKSWHICFSYVQINDDLASVAMSILSGDRYFYWVPTFDSRLKIPSIGKLHILYLIEYVFKNNISYFDFMGGTEPYKMQWTEKTYPIFSIYATKNPAKFISIKAMDYIKEKLKAYKNNYTIASALWKKISKRRVYVSSN